MRAVVRDQAGSVRVDNVPDARLAGPSDAVVRVVLSAVCGTDLRGYQGLEYVPPGPRAGHEFLGIVEDIGPEVQNLRRGDLVLAPFLWADGQCLPCRDGWPSSCPNGGMWGGEHDGGQGEAVAVPFADATLVPLQMDERDERLPAVLCLADVMATGTHAAHHAGLALGVSVAVVGDGAVGLCAVLAARRLGAGRVILLGTHPARAALGAAFGASIVLSARGSQAAAEVRELTGGRGPDAVLECTGTSQSLATATAAVRDGGTVVLCGGPHGGPVDLNAVFLRNLTIVGSLTPARVLIEPLLADVMAGRLDPSPLFDLTVGLDGVPDAYQAMAERRAIKALIRI